MDSIITFGESSSDVASWIAVLYDPETEQYRTLANLHCRRFPTVVHFGEGRIMIAGGKIDEESISTAEVFSCREKLCRTVASLNVARWSHGACAVGDAVVVCGGGDGGRIHKSCEIFCENRWSPLPDMLQMRYGCAVVSSVDRRVFAIGGYSGREDRESSVEFCRLPLEFASSDLPSECFWKGLPPMREPREGPGAVIIQESLFVVGGFNRISSIEMFRIDEENSEWISLPFSLNKPRGFFSIVTSSQGIYAFGNNEIPHNSVQRLHLIGYSKHEKESTSDYRHDKFASSQWKSLSPILSMHDARCAVLVPRALI